MNVKFLKIFIVGAFLAFAGGAFFMSGGDKIAAQSKEAVRKKAGILEKVASYKTWKQVIKTDRQSKAEVISITDSTFYG